MRLLLDMGLSTATAVLLRSNGFDTVHLRERNLQRLPDDRIFDLAKDESRIIVTCDLDFARILAHAGRTLPSLILFRLETYTTSQINLRLTGVLKDHEEALREGAIIVVEEGRERVRKLPIA